MDRATCDHPPGTTCIAAPPLSLAEVRRRFEQEAVLGVCDTGRYRCAYYAWGRGPTLLFVHGLADTAASFLLPISLLAAHFRCVAFELPAGRGDGARLGRYRHADLVADVFALLDHLGAGRAYLFGSSFGATVALAALHARPGRVPRAVLQGGFARRPLARPELLLARAARYWPGAMRWLPFRGPLLKRHHHAPFAGRPPEFWRCFLDNAGTNPIAAVARRAVLMHGLDLRPVLPRVRQPVLLVCGDHDPLVDEACEEELLRGLPHVARVEFEGCGHFPYFTHPEALAEVVRRFLTPP